MNIPKMEKNVEHERFVELLYAGVLRRPADRVGVRDFSQQLREGRSPLSLLEEFCAGDGLKTAADRLFVPPGHFYSPIVNPIQAGSKHVANWEVLTNASIGIAIDGEKMELLWRSWLPLLRSIPFEDVQSVGRRYRFDNNWFRWGDACVYYAMLKTLQPNRIVEVGSGFSSALALDTLQLIEKTKTKMTLIEPDATRLRALIGEGHLDEVTLHETDVQSVSLDVFKELTAGDFLFIDSTHVLKTGSDVNHLLFNVLPVLNIGVHIHFHDIYFPFEYPPSWAMEQNRSWNEAYALRAFLTGNSAFEITFFNDFFRRNSPELAQDGSVPFWKDPGGSIWLKKLQ